jgi:universal stress protein A
MFKRILVPTDFSDPSDAALDYARVLAGQFNATIQLLHVVEPPFDAAAFSNEALIGNTAGIYEALMTEARSQLACRARPDDIARHGITTEIVTGQSAATIVQYATDHRMDLIVMGTHGRTGIAHLLMGSVAEHVVRRAVCPVMTVRYSPAPEGPIVSTSHQACRSDAGRYRR